MVLHRRSSLNLVGSARKLFLVFVVVGSSMGWVTPAAGQPSQQRLPINIELIDEQTQAGLLIGETLWDQTADDRFAAFVETHASGPVHWVGDGLVHFSIQEPNQKINVALVNLTASRGVAVSPADRRNVVGSYASEIGAQVAINGNWFAPFDGPAVSNGQVYGGPDHAYTALIGFTEGNDVILQNHRVVNDTIDPRISNGVSGHPTLIQNRQIQPINPDPTFLNRHPRTIVGVADAGGILLLVTVDGRQPGAAGMTGDESASLMFRLGAEQALMLDGGGSSTMWIEGLGIVNSPPGPPRPVANELVAFSG